MAESGFDLPRKPDESIGSWHRRKGAAIRNSRIRMWGTSYEANCEICNFETAMFGYLTIAFNGKRTVRERMPRQLNVDDEMKARITLIVSDTGLTRQQVIYKALQFGVNHHPQFTIHEIERMFTHANARARASAHANEPKEGTNS